MLKTGLTLLRLCCYAVLVVIGVDFAACNNGYVDLTFYPLPYSFSVRLFLVTLVVFSAGVLTAWVIMRFSTFRERMQHRKTVKRMQALENEISALRSEQLAREQQLAVKPLSLVK